MPVIAIGSADIYRLHNNKQPVLTTAQLLLIAVAGILPDLLWPHTSMHGRLTSWTHTIWFLLVLFMVVYFISKRVLNKKHTTFAVLFWFAAALHIFADAISGGVAFFYPVEKVVGARHIPYRYWLYFDLVFVTVTAILFVMRSRLKNYRRSLRV